MVGGILLTEYILESVRDSLGYTNIPDFDKEVLLHVNAALMVLAQNGCGRHIDLSEGTTWEEFLEPDRPKTNDEMLPIAKAYTFMRTKQLFDPPPPNTAGYYDQISNEYLWRIREGYGIKEENYE